MHISELDVTNLDRGHKDARWLDISPRVEGGYWQIPFLSITGAEPGPHPRRLRRCPRRRIRRRRSHPPHRRTD